MDNFSMDIFNVCSSVQNIFVTPYYYHKFDSCFQI